MKAKWLSTLSIVSILVLALVPVAGAQGGVTPVEPLSPPPSAETGEMVNETPTVWFVELSSAPVADGGSLSKTQSDKKNFRTAAQQMGIQFTERAGYDTLWNGLSIGLNQKDVNKLRAMPGVKAVYPVDTIRIPETTPLDPELATALAMTGADIAQSELGYTGTGVRVAVMDTGVDYNHPDLGGCFGSGCRVVTGWDFVGDAFNADPASPAFNPVAVPDNDPDDCNGHGTHVAGIVGASGEVVGVAPGVTFGAYRVFGCEGSTTSDIMLAAMERALADNMQVLNMSIGSAYQWPQYPTAQAADRLVKKGMVVVASIGNSGANGLYSAGAPGLGKDVIGVASFDNTIATSFAFSITPDNKLIGYVSASAAPPTPQSGGGELARTGTQTSTADACTALPAGSLAGKIALIRRGTCGFYNKALNAQNAGAIAVVLYNNQPGSVTPTVAPVAPLTTPIVIPVVMVSQTDGNLIDSRLASGPVTLTWTDQTVTSPVATAGLISSFSSYGLSPDLALKPDIGAPGGNIWSTYPLEKGGFANVSGTSMASPHVAGAVALLLQARPNVKANEVRDILQNNADPAPFWGNPNLGLDNVHRQGAGMLDIDDSILGRTIITPGKIAAGEGEAGPFAQNLTVKNTSTASITYDLSYANALSTSGVIVPGFATSNASVTFSAASVTVAAGKTATVTATINPATGPVNGQYGGYIVFTPQGGGQVYRVPFAGFVGDYQGIQVLTPTANNFPRLGWSPDGVNFGFAAAGDTFTLQGFDVPYVLIHFDHQVQVFHMRAFNADGSPVHPVHNFALKEEYLPRNATTTGFFAFAWDGTRLQNNGNDKVKTVPDGAYYLVIEVLKANGNPSNPAHWETWTSPVFNIDRP